MRTAARLAACLAAPLLAVPVLAQTGQQNVEDSQCYTQLRDKVPGLEASLSGDANQQLRMLIRPAIILARRGNEAACEAILQEIERIAEEAAGTAPEPAQRQAALAEARAIGPDQMVRAEQLLDRDIVTAEDEEVGEVQDILVVTGADARAYAVVDRDGWFQEGAEQAIVPFDMLSMTTQGDIVFGAGEDMLAGAPQIEPEQIESAAQLEEIDSYWSR